MILLIVKNVVTTPAPLIPEELSKKLTIVATYKLTEYEAKLFSLALQSIVKQLIFENRDFSSIPRVNAIITEDGKVELEISNKNTIGTHVSLVIYAVKRWHDLNYGDSNIITVYLEELCHNYWDIEDEIKVKHKVYEIMKWTFPNITFKEVYTL